MVLALLTIIRPLQVSPIWAVQKAAAEQMKSAEQARPLRVVRQTRLPGLGDDHAGR
jgi:hypothetical protein